MLLHKRMSTNYRKWDILFSPRKKVSLQADWWGPADSRSSTSLNVQWKIFSPKHPGTLKVKKFSLPADQRTKQSIRFVSSGIGHPEKWDSPLPMLPPNEAR